MKPKRGPKVVYVVVDKNRWPWIAGRRGNAKAKAKDWDEVFPENAPHTVETYDRRERAK